MGSPPSRPGCRPTGGLDGLDGDSPRSTSVASTSSRLFFEQWTSWATTRRGQRPLARTMGRARAMSCSSAVSPTRSPKAMAPSRHRSAMVTAADASSGVTTRASGMTAPGAAGGHEDGQLHGHGVEPLEHGARPLVGERVGGLDARGEAVDDGEGITLELDATVGGLGPEVDFGEARDESGALGHEVVGGFFEATTGRQVGRHRDREPGHETGADIACGDDLEDRGRGGAEDAEVRVLHAHLIDGGRAALDALGGALVAVGPALVQLQEEPAQPGEVLRMVELVERLSRLVEVPQAPVGASVGELLDESFGRGLLGEAAVGDRVGEQVEPSPAALVLRDRVEGPIRSAKNDVGRPRG